MRLIAFIAVILSGCASEPAIESQTPLSVTYCAEEDSEISPDKLAAEHCMKEGLIAKAVVNNSYCPQGLRREKRFSYECVKRPE